LAPHFVFAIRKAFLSNRVTGTLADLSVRDCSVYTQRAYAIGLAHFFSWLHASGQQPDRVTRQIVGSYNADFARGSKLGAVASRSAQTASPRGFFRWTSDSTTKAGRRSEN
jgi:site-specific recombinase XerD